VQDDQKKSKYTEIIIAYPFALIVAAMIVNGVIGIASAEIALPSRSVMAGLGVSAALLVANHIGLMTSTELTRLKYELHATPEEWAASGTSPKDASPEGVAELARRHNAHRNATENTVYFALVAALASMVTPSEVIMWLWAVGFAIGRVGHSFSYLTGRDGMRGIFMSVSLMSLFGLLGYFLVSLMI